ncbi:hypothetical protein KSP40_PGU001023 [Platanthera guangdongensis]|uniref:Cupin type-1 domain-containing protein n=1 Tax=Platanthera guangdongensis TaxID=2320717 RepID=A0ABR2MSS1_9ASPA
MAFLILLLLPLSITGLQPRHCLESEASISEIAVLLVPSCSESFQFFEEQGRGHGQGQRKPPSTDQHQKIFDFHRGDIIVVPSGFVHWCYNNGDRSLVTLRDTNSSTNQLDSTINISCWPKAAKTQKGETQGSSSSDHLLRAFNRKMPLTEVLGGTDFIYLLEFRD